MAFVVSQGQVLGLNRPSTVMPGRVLLSDTLAQDYATIWKTQPQVRTVVSFLARNIAQIGLHVYRRVSDTDRERLTQHPLAQLIAKPNARTTRYRLIDALVNDLGIYDVAFWLKVKASDQPNGLLRLPPSQVTPLGDSWAWPDGFLFAGSRGKKELTADEVVFFRGYNPTDARWGVSPMETLRRILAEEYQAAAYREKLWRNGARFPGVIERPVGALWEDPQRERFRNDWKGLYTGDGPGVGGTPVLEDGMTYKPSGITPEQAQYLEARKLTREEVAAAFHIPLPMVGILDHATFSNITEQHKQLYQDTLGPWLTMIEEEIALQLLPDVDDNAAVYVEFNLAEKLKGSFEEQATSLQSAVGAPYLTRNEARARQNLPQIPGGDALVVPLNVLVGGQASPTDSAPPGLSRVPTAKAFAAVVSKARAGETYEQKHAEVVGAFFRRQAAVVKSRLGVKADADWWDDERWDNELSDDLYALAVQVSREVAAKTLESIGFSPDEYDVDRTVAWLREVSKRSARSINAVTKAQVAEALAGDAPDEAVKSVFTVAEGQRTPTIAATAVTLLSAFATHEAAKQVAGDKATKTWVTGPNPRPEHAAMNGETVPLSENFSNGMAWPGDGANAGPDDLAGCNCQLSISVA